MDEQPVATEDARRVDAWRTALLVVAAALLWLVLALLRDGVTYHLAPVIVAAAPPVLGLGGATIRGRVQAAAAGAVLAVLVAIVLAAAGAMDGPWLVGGSALGETLLGAVLGGVLGPVIAHLVGPE